MRALFLLFFALVVDFTGFCQGISDATIRAFASSYTAETAKDYSKAISDLGPVYADDFYEVNLRLGWLHLQKKEYDESKKYYRQAMKVRPSSIEAAFGFVNAAAAKSEWAEVFATYQKILTLDPANSLANYRLALMYYYRKEWGSATARLQHVLEHYPFDYDSILLMAQIKLAEGKMAESRSYYQRALLYAPSNDAIRAVMSKL